jgi:hypothetical protein
MPFVLKFADPLVKGIQIAFQVLNFVLNGK